VIWVDRDSTPLLPATTPCFSTCDRRPLLRVPSRQRLNHTKIGVPNVISRKSPQTLRTTSSARWQPRTPSRPEKRSTTGSIATASPRPSRNGTSGWRNSYPTAVSSGHERKEGGAIHPLFLCSESRRTFRLRKANFCGVCRRSLSIRYEVSPPMFTPQPIGFVESPYKNSREIPKGPGAKHEAEGSLKDTARIRGGAY
jgi:hypothetical protein